MLGLRDSDRDDTGDRTAIGSAAISTALGAAAVSPRPAVAAGAVDAPAAAQETFAETDRLRERGQGFHSFLENIKNADRLREQEQDRDRDREDKPARAEKLETLLAQAEASLARGDVDRALADLDRAVALAPQNDRAFALRSRAYEQKGDYKQALQDLNQAAALDPKWAEGGPWGRRERLEKLADPVWARCIESFGLGESARDRKIEACTEILARKPAARRKEALKQRADGYNLSSRAALAIADYTTALQIDPNDTEILFRRSRLFANPFEKKYDMAIVDLNQIIALDPRSARAFIERGSIYEIKGDFALAERDYRTAMEIDPSSNARSDLANLQYKLSGNKEADSDIEYKTCTDMSKEPNERIVACSSVVDRLPEFEISEWYSVIASNSDDISHSFTVAAGLDRKWLKLSGAFGFRGAAYHDKGDINSALVDLNNAIDKSGLLISRDGTASFRDQLLLRRGRIYLEAKEYERAEADFRTVIEINFVPDGHSYLALLHFTRKQYDLALGEANLALKRDPKNVLAFSVRGRSWLEMRKYEQALKDCQRAVDIAGSTKSPNALRCVEAAQKALAGGPRQDPMPSPSATPPQQQSGRAE